MPQDHITLERLPDYWNAASIHVDRVLYLTMPDSSVRLANLQAGAIDISEHIAPTDAKTVEKDKRLKLVVSDALGYHGITNNLANGKRADTPYGRDARVRKAFELAIDRGALINVVFNGLYPPSAQAIPPTSPYHVASIAPSERDIAMAKTLLHQAGISPPVPLELSLANSPDMVQVGEVIQSMAAEAGFDVKIRAMEARALLNAQLQGDFQAAVSYWSGRIDPDGNMYSFLHSGAPLNEGHYSNTVLDALLDQARQVMEIDNRGAIYNKVWEQEAHELPITYLWTWKNVAGVSAKVQGFEPIPDGLIRLQGISLAR